MRYRDLLEVKPTLEVLLKSNKLPIKTAFKISKKTMQLEQEYNLIEQSRLRLIDKYGVSETDGGKKIPEDKTSLFIGDFDKILEEEFSFERVEIPIEDLEGIGLSPLNLIHLEKLFLIK